VDEDDEEMGELYCVCRQVSFGEMVCFL
jgi:hypothetical protein